MIEEIRVPITIDLIIRLKVLQDEKNRVSVEIDVPVREDVSEFGRMMKKEGEQRAKRIDQAIIDTIAPTVATRGAGDPIACDYPGCGKVCRNQANLNKHKSWHSSRKPRGPHFIIPYKIKSLSDVVPVVVKVPRFNPVTPTTDPKEIIDFNHFKPAPTVVATPTPDPREVKDPNPHEPTVKNFGKEVEVLDCPNPKCHYKKRFIAGMGFVANDKIWCCAKCCDEYTSAVAKDLNE